jgi:hypothetical protein
MIDISLHIGERLENRTNPFFGFHINRDAATFDSSMFLWKSSPEILEQYMERFGYRKSGCFLYLPYDYQGWHTNGNIPAQRIYFAWASESNKSGMKFWLNGEIIDSPDKEGWNRRSFTAPIWHCVYSNCIRASVGFMSRQKDIIEDFMQPVSSPNLEDLLPTPKQGIIT